MGGPPYRLRVRYSASLCTNRPLLQTIAPVVLRCMGTMQSAPLFRCDRQFDQPNSYSIPTGLFALLGNGKLAGAWEAIFNRIQLLMSDCQVYGIHLATDWQLTYLQLDGTDITAMRFASLFDDDCEWSLVFCPKTGVIFDLCSWLRSLQQCASSQRTGQYLPRMGWTTKCRWSHFHSCMGRLRHSCVSLLWSLDSFELSSSSCSH